MSIRAWTAEEVRALGVRTDLVTACEVVYGCGRTKSYELLRTGQLDFPVLRVGHRIVVPVRPLLDLLGLTPDSSEGRPASRPIALTDQRLAGGPSEPDRTSAHNRSA